MSNCPNCGAPITGDRCEYCGTVFRKEKQEDKRIAADDFADALRNTFDNQDTVFNGIEEGIYEVERRLRLIRASLAVLIPVCISIIVRVLLWIVFE